MNITFLIGNGFDLNLGLKTDYSSFIKSYLTSNEKDLEEVTWFKKLIKREEKKWSDAEIALGKSTIDFAKNYYSAQEFCECHEDFCNKLGEYLEKEEDRFTEKVATTQVSTKFGQSVVNWFEGFRETPRESLYAILNKNTGGYCFNFISFNYTDTLDILVQLIRNTKNILGTRRCGTAAYENSVGKLLHVHGYVDKNMIFGVNDISQVACSDIFEGFGEEYLGQVIKQSCNEMYEENMDKKVHELLKKSDIIYVYGMSIGVTDKLWWERICSILKEKPQVQLIIHAFEAPKEGRLYRKFVTYSKACRNKFMDYGKFSEDERRELAPRIHIDKTNIFESLKDIVNDGKNER